MVPFGKTFFVGLLAGLLFQAGCKKPPTEKSTVLNSNGIFETPELVLKGLRVQSYLKNSLEWNMDAQKGEGFTTSSFFRLFEMNLDLFKNGGKSAAIQSDQAFIDFSQTGSSQPVVQKMTGFAMGPGDMLALGNVVVVSTDGSKLLTDWLHYHRQTDLITSTAPVQLLRADSLTHGTGLEATPDLTRVKIFKQTVVIKGEEGKE